MNRFDFLAWLCCPCQSTQFQIWKASHPELAEADKVTLMNAYNEDQQIKAYWKSGMGRFNRDIVMFWHRIQSFDPKVLLWRLDLVKRRGLLRGCTRRHAHSNEPGSIGFKAESTVLGEGMEALPETTALPIAITSLRQVDALIHEFVYRQDPYLGDFIAIDTPLYSTETDSAIPIAEKYGFSCTSVLLLSGTHWLVDDPAETTAAWLDPSLPLAICLTALEQEGVVFKLDIADEAIASALS